MSILIHKGDCREVLTTMPDESVHCVVTSPPYFGLRDYGVAGQIGAEETAHEYIVAMIGLFREVRRVLRNDGTLWLNLGDSFIDKQVAAIPWRVALGLRTDGWRLRQDIIWHKPNPMPESVRDRCTKAHEYLFLLTKSERYWFDASAIAEPAAPSTVERAAKGYAHGGSNAPGRGDAGAVVRTFSADPINRRSVWSIATSPFAEAHFATFPPELPELCIKAGCPAGGTVLDPFGGAGTTGLVADRLGRNAILIELNPEYAGMAHERLKRDVGRLFVPGLGSLTSTTLPLRRL